MRYLALDTETTGTNVWKGARPFCVSGCTDKGVRYCFEWPVNHKTRKVDYPPNEVANVRELIHNAERLVFHNALFDVLQLEQVGIQIPWEIVEDTLPMSHVVDSFGSHELKDLALLYCDIFDKDEDTLLIKTRQLHTEAKKKGWNVSETVRHDYWLAKAFNPKSTLLREYALTDAKRTMLLFLKLQTILHKRGDWHHYERERQLLPVIHAMHKRGVTINRTRAEKELTRYAYSAKKHKRLVCKVAESYGFENFNPSSTKQLGELLFDKLKYPILTKTPGGAASTAAEVLETLSALPNKRANGVLSDLLAYRKSTSACTYLQQYVDAAIGNLLHPSFLPQGTRTTRFSSHNPNAQNVSKDESLPLRGIFQPKPGTFWLDYDYSNIEMRIFAYLAGEKELIKAFTEGGSFHLAIAKRLYGPNITNEDPRYDSVKNGNFSIIYGASPHRADATYGLAGAYEKVRGEFPGLAKLFDRVVKEAKRDHCVKTVFGYPLRVPPEKSYVGVNSICQGTAGDVMKRAMIAIDQKIDPKDACLILTIHDELILQVPNRHYHNKALFDKIASLMEAPGNEIGIPTPVSRYRVTKSWDKKEVLT